MACVRPALAHDIVIEGHTRGASQGQRCRLDAAARGLRMLRSRRWDAPIQAAVGAVDEVGFAIESDQWKDLNARASCSGFCAARGSRARRAASWRERLHRFIDWTSQQHRFPQEASKPEPYTRTALRAPSPPPNKRFWALWKVACTWPLVAKLLRRAAPSLEPPCCPRTGGHDDDFGMSDTSHTSRAFPATRLDPAAKYASCSVGLRLFD